MMKTPQTEPCSSICCFRENIMGMSSTVATTALRGKQNCLYLKYGSVLCEQQPLNCNYTSICCIESREGPTFLILMMSVWRSIKCYIIGLDIRGIAVCSWPVCGFLLMDADSVFLYGPRLRSRLENGSWMVWNLPPGLRPVFKLWELDIWCWYVLPP